MTDRVMIATFIAAILILGPGTFLFGNYLRSGVTIDPVRTPAFKTGDCYMSTGVHEVWEPRPEGIIVKAGYLSYLTMHAIEANRTTAGNKIGVTVESEEFDSTHYKVDCPAAWQQHTSEKAKKGRPQGRPPSF